MNAKGRRGFTLIELLMVVLVILLLSAMLYRVASLVADRAARTKSQADLENIAHALEEYMAEYGTYPPTIGMRYVYENSEHQSEVFRRGNQESPGRMTDKDIGYEYGLTSFLLKRDMGSWNTSAAPIKRQIVGYDGDTERDKAAKERWAHFLTDVSRGGSLSGKVNNDFGSPQSYSNSVLTLVDPWGIDFGYESRPPYLTYRLWSSGSGVEMMVGGGNL